MSCSEWTHLENCSVEGASEKAILVRYNEKEYWLPRSQVSEGEKYEIGDEDVTISITEWIAKEKNISVD